MDINSIGYSVEPFPKHRAFETGQRKSDNDNRNMQVNFYVFLAFIGIAVAARCRIVGPEHDRANCRSCPARGCDITNTIRPGRSRNIDCVFSRGEDIRGDR